jgi:preprotein translocase subunit YajC
MFISPAFAQAAGGGDPMASVMQFLPLVLIFGVFYMLMIRPQQKRMKEHKAKLSSIRRGDRVMTGGGLIATVVKVADDELVVDLAENVRVKVVRSTIADVMSKTEPTKGGKADKASKDEDEAETANDDASAPEDGKAQGLKGLLSKK